MPTDFLNKLIGDEPPVSSNKSDFDYSNLFDISEWRETLNQKIHDNLFSFIKLDDCQRGTAIYNLLFYVSPIGKKREFKNVNIKKFYNYLKSAGFKMLFNNASSTFQYSCGFYIRESDNIIIQLSNNIDESVFSAILYGSDTQRPDLEKLFITLNRFKNNPKKSEIGFLVQLENQLAVNKYPTAKVKCDLALNYNNDFEAAHAKIVEFINSNNSGLVCLRGNPGTGKSFYLKSLINNSNKTFIYLGKNAVDIFCSPSFIGFALEELKDTILIIEDAETILISNDGLRSGATVNILNLTDGILADIVKLKIITTFNCQIDDLDKALLRKGRLKLKYEFKELSAEKSNNLLKKLGLDYITDVPMLLTDIYNLKEENGGQQVRKKVGF